MFEKKLVTTKYLKSLFYIQLLTPSRIIIKEWMKEKKLLFVSCNNGAQPWNFAGIIGDYWYDPVAESRVYKKNQINQEQVAANVCPQCGKCYIHSRHLKRHIKFECGNPRRFCCSYCDHRSNHKIDLQRHIVRRHQGKNIKFYVLK